ncbi:hypothetical protein C0995_013113 [Termitomyces sp. Mi166|nr:hypothetical protein C0995_013113 [Termitomyces sp. Mi166\
MTNSETSPSTSRPPVPKPKLTTSLESDVSSTTKQTKGETKLNRSRKDNNLDATKEFAPEDVPKKEKKSKKRKREADLPVDDHAETKEDSGKKIKKKLKHTEEVDSHTITSDVVPAKKRKNKTGFPDPNEDACLSEQSKKYFSKQLGLAYAFLQFHRPSKWKFNKARQNWILRNIWSSEMIPETHLPLAYGYLAKVQGGVREVKQAITLLGNLLLLCRTILENPKVEATSSEKAGPVDGTPAETGSTPTTLPTPSVIENSKEIRAQALIDLLSSSDTVAS